MKPVFINFTDSEGKTIKTYSTCSLKSGTMDNIFDIAEKASKLQAGNLNMSEIRSFFKDLKAIIVDIFGKQFTFDDINTNVEHEELIKVFNEICANIAGEFQKN